MAHHAIQGAAAADNKLREHVKVLKNLETLYIVKDFENILSEAVPNKSVQRISTTQITQPTYFRRTSSDFVWKRWNVDLLRLTPQAITAPLIAMMTWGVDNAILVEWPASAQALSMTPKAILTGSKKRQSVKETTMDIKLSDLLEDHESLI